MGTWGTGLYSDDFAADLRGDFRDLLGEGLAGSAAVDQLMSDYADSLADPDEEPVFWLALADISWKLGRMDERVRENALRIIDEGRDLARWESPRDRTKREAVLAKLRAQLLPSRPRKGYRRQSSPRTSGWLARCSRFSSFRVGGSHGALSAITQIRAGVSPSASSLTGSARPFRPARTLAHWRFDAKRAREEFPNSFFRSRGQPRIRSVLCARESDRPRRSNPVGTLCSSGRMSTV